MRRGDMCEGGMGRSPLERRVKVTVRCIGRLGAIYKGPGSKENRCGNPKNVHPRSETGACPNLDIMTNPLSKPVHNDSIRICRGSWLILNQVRPDSSGLGRRPQPILHCQAHRMPIHAHIHVASPPHIPFTWAVVLIQIRPIVVPSSALTSDKLEITICRTPLSAHKCSFRKLRLLRCRLSLLQ